MVCSVSSDLLDHLLMAPGILYANLSGFPIVFIEIRGMGPVVGSLPFLFLLVGILFAAAVNILNNKYYSNCLRANNFRPVPEARLPPMMIGSFGFTAGLFLFGCKYFSPTQIQ